MSKEKDFIKKIWISPYTLKKDMSEGALLKVLFSQSGLGYSQVHPLKHEGTLLNSLQVLKGCLSRRILNVNLQIAQEDAKARAENKSLLKNFDPIESHYLISNISKESPDKNFSYIKIKMGHCLKEETLFLREKIKESRWKFRLDFNERISKDTWLKWEKENKDLAEFIDFVEDPFLNFYFIPSDFSLAQDLTQTHYCPIRVIKGSRYSLSSLFQMVASSKAQRFVFTHSLAHPLEARISYLRACQFYKVYPRKKEVCGLHYNLEPYNDFSRYYSQIYSPLGTGLGFDEIWDKQKWISLESI